MDTDIFFLFLPLGRCVFMTNVKPVNTTKYTHTHIHIQKYTHELYMQTHVHTYIGTHTNYEYSNKHFCPLTYTYADTHIHTQTHTHTHKRDNYSLHRTIIYCLRAQTQQAN